ncbi:exosortase system-associated protein, TIGR04073 family [uncultured Victivallis sp.]|uniref:exosortase system-associated protein, TIGR04073 family n=1 Tax=Victivallis sp. TaxID=2049020 RepID=UPI0025EF0FAA|nr:exosortase system-associated protein, TIGR04073 family [uncultured Victivallis sp.]
MRFGKSVVASVILAVMMIGVSVQAAPDDPWVMKPVEKLGRGIANVAFGPLEILIRGWDVTQELGGIAGITYGPLKGVAYCIAREVVGVIDIVTFPVPLPDCPEDPEGFGAGYGPIMRPAWVVDIEHNAFNFVFDDSSIVSSDY